MKTYLTFLLLISFSISSSSEEAYADLDARITYEMAKDGGIDLESILLIEQELMASSIDGKTLYLVARVNELKEHLLATEDDGKVALAQKNNQPKGKSVSISQNDDISSSVTDTDGPVLNSILFIGKVL